MAGSTGQCVLGRRGRSHSGQCPCPWALHGGLFLAVKWGEPLSEASSPQARLGLPFPPVKKRRIRRQEQVQVVRSQAGWGSIFTTASCPVRYSHVPALSLSFPSC